MKLPHIIWEPRYSVHVEELDAQHRRLFEITNGLVDAWEGDSPDAFSALKALVDYLSLHFHTEHMVMKRSEYPGLAGHSQEHGEFNRKMGEFIRGYREERQTLMFDMVVFLRNWVLTHTCEIDQAYGRHILMRQAKAAPLSEG